MRPINKLPNKLPSKYNPSSRFHNQDDEEEVEQPKATVSGAEQTLAEKKWFDFSNNDSITVEKIVRSTIANPNRAKFPKKFKNERIYPCDDPEWFL